MKIPDFLLADMRASLDNLKAPLNLVELWTKYYEYFTRTVLESLNIRRIREHLVRFCFSSRSLSLLLSLFPTGVDSIRMTD